MRQRLLLLIGLFFSVSLYAADSTRLYNPSANAARDIAELLVKAKAEKKHVLLQVGGNWCIWCYRFNAFVKTDSTLRRMQEGSYLVYHLNYSKENKNEAMLAKLGFPQRFGFPVLVVLDENGARLHTQDSSLLEKGNGYDFDKVKSFFYNWSPVALRPEQNQER